MSLDSLIGGGGSGAAAGPLVKDVDTASFAADVIEASMDMPVIVDFWATWCGPCKQLGPALERVVQAARGKVKLAKIDVDANQQLAAQMRVQSIPAVYAFFGGRPVDAFVGALPESQIKSFVDRLIQLAGGEDPALTDALAQAAAALEAEDWQAAGAIYAQILQHEPAMPAAIAGMARAQIGAGHADQAEALLDRQPDDVAKAPEVASVRRELELRRQTAGKAGETAGLSARVAADPDDHQARLDLAEALFAAGDREGACDQLLESVRRDRDWNDGAARKQLLAFFEAFGPKDPLTVSARRRLSSVLFS